MDVGVQVPPRAHMMTPTVAGWGFCFTTLPRAPACVHTFYTDADITLSSLSRTTRRHQETCTTGWLDAIVLCTSWWTLRLHISTTISLSQKSRTKYIISSPQAYITRVIDTDGSIVCSLPKQDLCKLLCRRDATDHTYRSS